MREFVRIISFLIRGSRMNLNNSTLIIVDGIHTAKQLIWLFRLISESENVRIWNTFVQQECPVHDLSICHLIIIGSHMKLSSSITFPRCTRLFISDIMQVATSNRMNASVRLTRDFIPMSVYMQCIGRGNRDVSTDVWYYPAIFPNDLQKNRLQYPKVEVVSDFMLDFISVSVSDNKHLCRLFCTRYKVSMEKATQLFYSYAPVDLLLALNEYSQTRVRKDQVIEFKQSLNVLTALTYTVVFFSNPCNCPRMKLAVSDSNPDNVARIIGFVIIDVVNILCKYVPQVEVEDWNRLFDGEITILQIAEQIRGMITKSGSVSFNPQESHDTITCDVIAKFLNFSITYSDKIYPYFVQSLSTATFTAHTADSGESFNFIDLTTPVILPFGCIISANSSCLFPTFRISIPFIKPLPHAGGGSACHSSTERTCASGGSACHSSTERLCASGGSAHLSSERPHAGGGSAHLSSERPCASGGSARHLSSERPCASGGSAHLSSERPCASGGSVKPPTKKKPTQ